MIKKISAILLIAFTVSCAASPARAQAIPYIALESCEEMGSLAEFVMELRQEGVPMKDQWERATKSGDPVFEEWLKKVLIIVYDGPKYTSKRYQKQAASEFGSRAFVECLKVEKNLRK